MRKEEELDQLRAEKRALWEALQRKDEELEQARKANQDLREGLKQAIMATLVPARARESARRRASQREPQEQFASFHRSFCASPKELAAQERQEARRRDAASGASSRAG